MKIRLLLFISMLAFVAGCSDSQCFDSHMTYIGLTNNGLVTSSIQLDLKDSIPVGSVLVAHFETPKGEQVIEHLITKEDIAKKTVFLETNAMDNWDKWQYMVLVDVFADSTKNTKIETVKQNTVMQPMIRNSIKKLKESVRVPKDAVTFDFADANWVIGNEDGNVKTYFTEYVLRNETVDTWSELITYQVIYDIPNTTTLKDFMHVITKEFSKSDCNNFVSNVIMDTPDKIIYEWYHDGCKDWPKQHEIAVILLGSEGINSIRYTKKGIIIDSPKRQQIIDSLKRSQIVQK